jgi:cytochrome c oxidase cbb3-type subunit I/II
MGASVVWGIVGMLVGVLVALQLADPRFNLGLEWTSFGRLRPLHTNAVIFAFAGNAIFAAVYCSSQRLLKARMFSDLLSRVRFWGWQAIIVAAAITLPLGFTQSKEYAELEWPIDLAVVAVWVVFDEPTAECGESDGGGGQRGSVVTCEDSRRPAADALDRR